MFECAPRDNHLAPNANHLRGPRGRSFVAVGHGRLIELLAFDVFDTDRLLSVELYLGDEGVRPNRQLFRKCVLDPLDPLSRPVPYARVDGQRDEVHPFPLFNCRPVVVRIKLSDHGVANVLLWVNREVEW